MKGFGEKIEHLRKAHGLNVKDLCQRVGIPQSRLVELERGIRIPSKGQIEILEKFFGVPLADLAKFNPADYHW